MSTISFNVYKTNELSEAQLNSFVKNFNTVFEKNTTVSDFTKQYINNERGYSYHSLMETDDEAIGYISAIPFPYSFFKEKKTFAYLGSLFILPQYRKDPLAMFKLYRSIKQVLTDEGISLLMSVPNKNSHPYFIHALKWKQIGTLPYYALPIKYGTISGKNKVLDILSSAFTNTQLFLSDVFTIFLNSKEKKSDIFLIQHESLAEQQRYNEMHIKIKTKTFNAFYRVETEEGIKTAYLIDFYNKDHKRDSRSLTEAVRYIVKHATPDLVLFIGELKMTQAVLFKVPKAKEPRQLNFCAEILDKKNIDEKAYNASSWNFGLYNFDVR